jgi:phosphotransferase system  glucose/maltose/N-acetylglucosamine-specific IIC component
VEILVIWFALALAVGYGASQKGRNGFGWFLVALLFSPLIGGLFVLAMQRNVAPVAAAPVHAAAIPAPRPDHVAVLSSLSDLHDRGVLSDDEYATKKADVLARV